MNAMKRPQSLLEGLRLPTGVLILWVLVLSAIPITLMFTPAGWDVGVYHSAMGSLAANRDPYADAIAIQRVYHAQQFHPAGDPPYSYVYSPITLPLLSILTHSPMWVTALGYWIIFAFGVVAEISVAGCVAEATERDFVLYLAPVSIFFPGLLANGIILGGNIVYVLYGMVLLCACVGWKRHRWLYFYLAVLIASCVKAPLLSLAVIPIFSERKQTKAFCITVSLGLTLFAMTPLLWPTLFKHYLEAVELQFSFNHDLGCSPAGLLSELLISRRIPYSAAGLMFYLAYALPILAVLRHLSKSFFLGLLTLQQWMPVLLVGTILLNPRVLEYDLAAITIPLALIARRYFANIWGTKGGTFCFAALFTIANFVASGGWHLWKGTGGIILFTCFVAGCLDIKTTAEGKTGLTSSELRTATLMT